MLDSPAIFRKKSQRLRFQNEMGLVKGGWIQKNINKWAKATKTAYLSGYKGMLAYIKAVVEVLLFLSCKVEGSMNEICELPGCLVLCARGKPPCFLDFA